MRNTRGGGPSRSFAATCLLVLLGGLGASQTKFIDFSEIQPVIAAFRVSDPVHLETVPATASAWPAWIAGLDRRIRSRLAQGDEDTLINWLLLGRAFTMQPPVLLDASAASDEASLRRMAMVIGRRLSDVLRAAAVPGTDERRLFAKEVLLARGFDVATPAGGEAASAYLLAGIGRIIDEWTRLQRQASPQFVDRGLSLDTSLQPNFALERTLSALKTAGTVVPRSVRRVAVVGAGLDFADKNTGFDSYPVQSVQPFAVLDTLRRLDLVASEDGVEVEALDISPRVIAHIARASAQAGQSAGYTIHVALDSRREWVPEVREYWKAFGDRIGTPAPLSLSGASAAPAELRAVRVSALSARRISALDVNVVTERRQNEEFDLIVATNVLIYYGPFEQALALANLGAMLRPGGVLVTNDRLPALDALPLVRAGSHEVVYTRDGIGDRMDWYVRRQGSQ